MRATLENYKGIEFVRISSLPESQRILLKQSFDKSKIIKILKDDSLLSDCVVYSDYAEWFSKNLKPDPSPLISIPKMRPALEVA
jgi:hypothetical protein